MRLPSKVTTYKKSILSKFPLVLQKLEEQEKSPIDLYKSMANKFDGITEFIDVVDCLFALGEIKFSEDGERLAYVKRDSL